MNNKYNDGKIYIIRSPNIDRVYIGCTTRLLKQRMKEHNKVSNVCSSIDIIKAGGAYIELLENYPCNTKQELLNRERYHIINNNNNCCNNIHNINNVEYVNQKINNIKYINQKIKNMKEQHYKYILSKYKLKIINDNSDTEED